MPKAMKYRDLVAAMKAAGCQFLRAGKGDHEIWACPCGVHQATLVHATDVSQGVVVAAVRNLQCLKKGWLP